MEELKHMFSTCMEKSKGNEHATAFASKSSLEMQTSSLLPEGDGVAPKLDPKSNPAPVSDFTPK